MNQNYKLLIQKLKRLHWLFLLLAFAYTLAGQMYIFVLMDKQDEYAYYLNLAGRQRMLSQQIQSYADIATFRPLSQVEVQQLSEAQVAFDSALNILIQPTAMALFDRNFKPIAEHLYFANNSGISAQVHRYFVAIEEAKQPSFSPNISNIKQIQIELLEQLEQAVSLIEQQAQSRAAEIKLTLLLYLLGFFICLWVFIRKGIKPLEKSVQLALHGGFLNSETNHKTLQKVEYANRLKSELLIRATHALRGGLNGVDGMLSLIQQQPNEAQSLVKKAKTSSKHMLSIIDTLSNYAELTRNKTKVQHSLLSLNEFFAELHHNYQQLARDKDIELTLSIAPSVPTQIYLDEKILKNVFDPLIANAVNYTEIGHVQIHLGYAEEDNELVAQIHDTGIGISEEQLKLIKQHNIVEKGFNAADNSIGVGLLIVNRAIELLEAHLEISSRVGQGTSVHLTIPLADNKPIYMPSNSQIQLVDKMSYAAISEDPLFIHYYQSVFRSLHADLVVFTSVQQYAEADNYSVLLLDLATTQIDDELDKIKAQKLLFSGQLQQHKYPNLPRYLDTERLLQHLLEKMPVNNIRSAWPGKRVLVAEDNEINQEVITSMLENYQLDVQIAANGLVASDTAFKMNFDLILMDIQMPILDGIEATRKIRESGSQVPIVALTAHTYRTDEKLCFDVGMNGFLAKPIQAEKLSKVLARFFN